MRSHKEILLVETVDCFRHVSCFGRFQKIEDISKYKTLTPVSRYNKVRISRTFGDGVSCILDVFSVTLRIHNAF